jgi:nicotinamide riboside kinase
LSLICGKGTETVWIELPDEGLAWVGRQDACGEARWSDACQKRGAERKSESAQVAFSAARFALFQVLQRANREDVLQHLHYSSAGRPLLPPGLGFVALSHSATHAAAAFHPTRPVGIDVEGLRNQLARVAAKFVAPEEQGLDLRGLWGLKEAFYKAIGLPGLHFARDLRCSEEPTDASHGLAVFPEGEAHWNRTNVDDQCAVWALLPPPQHLLREPFRWVVTGAESSGKSTWAQDLATRLNLPLVPEGVRQWMVPGEDYTAAEVRKWAQQQAQLEAERAGNGSAVVDTDRVNFDVWLQVRFGERLDRAAIPQSSNAEEAPSEASTPEMDRWYAVLSPLETWEPDPLREAPDYADRLRIESLHRSAVESEEQGVRVGWWEVAQTPLGAEIAATASQNRWPALYLCKAQGCRSERNG